MERSADNAQKPHALPWPRRHAIALGVILALLLLYTLAGFLLVPYIARTRAIAYVQNDLHRRLTIDELKFNPFLLAVEIHGLNLTEADGSAIASFALLHVEFNAIASLFHGAWTLADVKLTAPSVDVIINKDGSLNLEKLAPSSAEPPPPPTPNASLPRVRIRLFSMHQGKVHFEDRSRDEQPFTATLTPIEFDLNDFRTQADFENRYQFSAASLAGERFDWSGQFALRPLSSNGTFSVSALKATTIASYLEDSLPCALNAGTLDLTGQYQFTAQNGGAPIINVALPSLQIHQLAIAPKGAPAGDTPWVSLPELDVNDTRVAVRDRTASVGEIVLQKPALQVWRESDGSINLMKLASSAKPAAAAMPAAAAATPPAGEPPPVAAAAPAAPGATIAAKGPPPAPWKVTLAKFSIQEADIAAEDRSVKPAMQMHVAPLNVSVQNITSQGTEPLTFDVDTGLNEHGHLHTAGQFVLTPMAAQLGIELKDLDLSAFQPYLTPEAQVALSHGDAGTDLKIEYAATPAKKGKPQLLVTGSALVSELATRDIVTGADFVDWKALELSGIHYQMNPTAVALDRIRLRGLLTHVAVAKNGTINIKDVTSAPGAAPPVASARPVSDEKVPTPAATAGSKSAGKGHGKGHGKPAASAPPPTSSPPPMPISVKRIDIEQSVLNFSDNSIEPSFSAGILNLHGSIVGLSSAPKTRAKITLDGQVDQFSPVQIRGEMSPFAPMVYTDVGLSFHNMELTTFNPYSGKYAGYDIQQGKLSTDLHYHIENRKLDATHHIEIDQLEFGQATDSKQAVPLPIKLAVAILKDRNGVITLDLPEITGTVDDPNFKVGPLIWTFVKDLLAKVITAPFAAIGHLFGGGPEMKFIEFPVGTATLLDSETDKLSKLSKALVERPQLKLDVPLHALVAADDDALAKAAFEQALTDTANGKKKSSKPVSGDNADPAARLKTLTALYKQKFDKEPEFPKDEDKSKKSADRDADHAAFLEQQLLPQFKPTADQRTELGKQRATAVQVALLANKELEPERVFLTDEQSGGDDAGKVRMELKLE